MTKFTVWIQQRDGRGTTHISSHEVESSPQAVKLAVETTCADWGEYNPDDLRVLGIAKGDIKIIEWSDHDDDSY